MSKGNFKGKTFEPLTEGDYLVRMTSCEEQTTKSGTGKYLKTCFQVVRGLKDEDKGRLIFANFNIENANKKAVDIGEKQLHHFLKAVGEPEGLKAIDKDYGRLSDYLELPFIATVKIKEGTDYVNKDGVKVEGKPQNIIYSFKAR